MPFKRIKRFMERKRPGSRASALPCPAPLPTSGKALISDTSRKRCYTAHQKSVSIVTNLGKASNSIVTLMVNGYSYQGLISRLLTG